MGQVVREGEHDCEITTDWKRGKIWRCDCGRHWEGTVDWKFSPQDGRTWKRLWWSVLWIWIKKVLP